MITTTNSEQENIPTTLSMFDTHAPLATVHDFYQEYERKVKIIRGANYKADAKGFIGWLSTQHGRIIIKVRDTPPPKLTALLPYKVDL
jgi:hypothetical protein